MFLAELLEHSHIAPKNVGKNDIVILQKGCRAGVDYNLVIDRTEYEDILVKYRAAEPASEAILMVLSGKKEPDDPMWDCLLQNEIIYQHYSKLCNEAHAQMLEELDKMEEQEEEESDTHVNEEVQISEDKEDTMDAGAPSEEEKIPISAMPDIPASLQLEEAMPTGPATMAQDVGSAEDTKVSLKKEEVSEEENYNFFVGVENKNTQYSFMQALPTEDTFTSFGEEVTPSDVEESPKESVQSQSPVELPEFEDTDYIPDGIRPEEENAAMMSNMSSKEPPPPPKEDPAKVEIETKKRLAEKVGSTCNELYDIFFQYGISNVCRQAGTTFYSLVLQLSTVSDKVRALLVANNWMQTVPANADVVRKILSALSEDGVSIICNNTGESREHKIEVLLDPITKILYEE